MYRSSNDSVNDDLKKCDVVLGGNSSMLVESVLMGCPSGYVYGLDYGERDLHEFVARGLVFPIEGEVDFQSMLDFYQAKNWKKTLELYANINEDELLVAKRLRAVLLEFTINNTTAH